MTAKQFAADLEALIAIARHEGLSDQELTALLRASTDALVPEPSSVSRIVQSRSKKTPRPTPAIAVPVVVFGAGSFGAGGRGLWCRVTKTQIETHGFRMSQLTAKAQ